MRDVYLMVLWAVSTLVWSGCGQKIEGPSQKLSQRPAVVFQGDPETVRRESKNAQFICTETIDEESFTQSICEPALALVSVVADGGGERCSGFLISPTEILTNDHCVDHLYQTPNHGSKSHVQCQDQVFVHFAETSDAKAVTVGCREIKTRSGESGIDSLDYAVIVLDQEVTQRKPLTIANRGFNADEKAKIMRVVMTGAYDGMQDTLDCQATYATYAYPEINSALSPLMTFGDCAILKGNSGSPVMNENGEVGAIIQGILELNEDHPDYKTLKEHLVSDSAGVVAVASSLSCAVELSPETAPKCTSVIKNSKVAVLDYLKTHNQFELSQLKANENWVWQQVNSSTDGLSRRYFSRPLCSSDDQFSSKIIEFELGVNSKMEAVWAPKAILGSAVFKKNKQINHQVNEFSNSSLATLDIQMCADETGFSIASTR